MRTCKVAGCKRLQRLACGYLVQSEVGAAHEMRRLVTRHGCRNVVVLIQLVILDRLVPGLAG